MLDAGLYLFVITVVYWGILNQLGKKLLKIK